ncbi:MAG: Nramp family divalent metal transporter [Candidatus Aminicenantales bacterium]
MASPKKTSRFGPGFLVTAAFIGPGTVTTCSMAGAQFGYSLLYAVILATIITFFLQEMTGRLALASGYDLGQALRDFPQKTITRLLFIILTLSSITFGCAAYEAGNIIGGSLGLEMVSSIPQKYWVVLISLIAAAILSRRRYQLVEKFLIFLVFLMSASFLATLIIIKPNLFEVIKGLLPTLPKNSLYLILALIGTTVVPYNLFLHSAAVKTKWSSKSNMREVKVDLALSIGLGGLISASIIVTAAVTFFQAGLPLEKGPQLAFQLKPLFGPLATLLFGLGFFAAGLSSALTAPYAAAFASAGVLGWEKGQYSKGFRWIWLGVILAGLAVSLFNFNPLAVILLAQVANGLILPVASIFLLIILNNRQRMGNFVNSLKRNIIGSIIITIVSFLGIWNVIKLFLK